MPFYAGRSGINYLSQLKCRPFFQETLNSKKKKKKKKYEGEYCSAVSHPFLFSDIFRKG